MRDDKYQCGIYHSPLRQFSNCGSFPLSAHDIERYACPGYAVAQEAPAGPDCTAMSGQQGFDITVTRVFHDLNSGAVLRTEDFRTHYAPEAVIHCVPPAQQPATTTPSVFTGYEWAGFFSHGRAWRATAARRCRVAGC